MKHYTPWWELVHPSETEQPLKTSTVGHMLIEARSPRIPWEGDSRTHRRFGRDKGHMSHDALPVASACPSRCFAEA